MNATTVLKLNDISQQKPFSTDLTTELTPNHQVGQAVDHYLSVKGIPAGGERWEVFSRGIKLDMKQPIKELEDEYDEWLLMPEISAGNGEAQ